MDMSKFFFSTLKRVIVKIEDDGLTIPVYTFKFKPTNEIFKWLELICICILPSSGGWSERGYTLDWNPCFSKTIWNGTHQRLHQSTREVGGVNVIFFSKLTWSVIRIFCFISISKERKRNLACKKLSEVKLFVRGIFNIFKTNKNRFLSVSLSILCKIWRSR